MLYTIGQMFIFVLPGLSRHEHQYIATWCNGNTSDFDSEDREGIVGSSPTVAAKIINGMCQDIDKHNAT